MNANLVRRWQWVLMWWAVMCVVVMCGLTAAMASPSARGENRVVVLGFTCNDIKRLAAKYGMGLLETHAEQWGLSPADVKAVRLCVGNRSTKRE